MKGLKGVALGLAALAAIGIGLLASSVFAVSGSASISSATAEPGGQATVELTSDVGDPGLGAWTIDITYDPDVVSVVDCAPEAGGVCNEEFGPDTVRITGASANGLEGPSSLGNITFECGDAEGTSALTLSLEVFADATVGDPTAIDPATTNDGSVECAEAEPTEPAPTATEAPELPPTGTGAGSSGGETAWVIAALAAAGLAVMLGLGAVRLRARRY